MLSIRREWDWVDGSDIHVASDRPDNELNGEPVVELRFMFALRLGDVVAAEDAQEDIQEDIEEDIAGDNREDNERDVE